MFFKVASNFCIDFKWGKGMVKWGAWYSGEHGIVVRAFVLYWGGNRLESLSTHYCWALSKSFIPSLVVSSVTQNLAEKSKNKKSNGEQSYLCDLEQDALKPQLQAHHYLSTWLQIWYHSLLRENPKGPRLRKAELLIRRPPAELGE